MLAVKINVLLFQG